MERRKSIKLSSETPEQELIKEDDNEYDETVEVEDEDIKDHDDIDNRNANINCKENKDDVDCDNKTQNTVENEVIVNKNYKKN